VAQATLLIKATRLCNLRCAYCHDWRTGPNQTMTFPVLARLIAAALRDPTHDGVRFTWHGGETTVLPIRFYEKALLLQARFRRPGQTIQNYLQTNATRLTPEWAQFLRANGFGVGLSVDGPAEIHDRYRRTAAGQPTFSAVMRGIALLREYDVPFGVLLVVDEDGLALGADRLFEFCLDLGLRHYGLNFVAPTNQPDAPPGTPTDHYVEPRRMVPFLARLYDRWREHGDPGIRIREVEVLRLRIAADTTHFCTLEGGCFGTIFGVEPNGDVSHCEEFVGDPRYTVGNILADDFAALRRNTRLLALQAENEQALASLRACPNFAVCNGWCPRQRYTSLRHNPDHRADCCGLSELIDHIRRGEASRAAAGAVRRAGAREHSAAEPR
jgi:uncharacterized protein